MYVLKTVFLQVMCCYQPLLLFYQEKEEKGKTKKEKKSVMSQQYGSLESMTMILSEPFCK